MSATLAHPARVYACLLGGKDHYPVDEAAAARLTDEAPWLPDAALAGRRFLLDAVALLARAGIVQFLDLGCGLPADPNVHEAVGAANPAARTVYLDNDPLVLTYARALLTGPATGVLDGDLRRPRELLADVRGHLDLDKPVVVVLAAVLQHLGHAEATDLLHHLGRALAPDSHLVLTHPAATIGAHQIVLRTPRQLTDLLTTTGFHPLDTIRWARPGAGLARVPTLIGLARPSSGPRPSDPRA